MLSNPHKWFHELKEPFKGSKILFREPNKVPHGVHRTFKDSYGEPSRVLPIQDKERTLFAPFFLKSVAPNMLVVSFLNSEA